MEQVRQRVEEKRNQARSAPTTSRRRVVSTTATATASCSSSQHDSQARAFCLCRCCTLCGEHLAATSNQRPLLTPTTPLSSFSSASRPSTPAVLDCCICLPSSSSVSRSVTPTIGRAPSHSLAGSASSSGDSSSSSSSSPALLPILACCARGRRRRQPCCS